jgi:hypothetical protein
MQVFLIFIDLFSLHQWTNLKHDIQLINLRRAQNIYWLVSSLTFMTFFSRFKWIPRYPNSSMIVPQRLCSFSYSLFLPFHFLNLYSDLSKQRVWISMEGEVKQFHCFGKLPSLVKKFYICESWFAQSYSNMDLIFKPKEIEKIHFPIDWNPMPSVLSWQNCQSFIRAKKVAFQLIRSRHWRIASEPDVITRLLCKSPVESMVRNTVSVVVNL